MPGEQATRRFDDGCDDDSQVIMMIKFECRWKFIVLDDAQHMTARMRRTGKLDAQALHFFVHPEADEPIDEYGSFI